MNGTYINGQRMGAEPRTLYDGDIVVFGSGIYRDQSQRLMFRFSRTCDCFVKDEKSKSTAGENAIAEKATIERINQYQEHAGTDIDASSSGSDTVMLTPTHSGQTRTDCNLVVVPARVHAHERREHNESFNIDSMDSSSSRSSSSSIPARYKHGQKHSQNGYDGNHGGSSSSSSTVQAPGSIHTQVHGRSRWNDWSSSKKKRPRYSRDNKGPGGITNGGESKYSSTVDWVMAHAKKLKLKTAKDKTKVQTMTTTDIENDIEKQIRADQTIPSHMQPIIVNRVDIEQKLDQIIKGQGSLEENKRSNTPSSSSKVENSLRSMMNELESELTCPICTDVFLKTTTLNCGHSFCSQCISKWLRTSLKCPLCRTALTKPPVYSHSLDRTIEIMIHCKKEKKAAFLKREADAAKELEYSLKQKEKFDRLLSQARKEGYRLVHISNIWSFREKNRFLKGISRHYGAARLAYCASVSLSTELVARSAEPDLAVIAYNLNLKQSSESGNNMANSADNHDLEYYNDWAKNHVAELRSRIIMFIQYG